MAGPYRGIYYTLKINGTEVGVVTATDMQLQREGGAVEHVYGQDTGYISLGGKRATFTVQRWFMTASDTDMLFDLFDQKLPFELSGELNGVSSSMVSISNCVANSWRQILGDANTIIAEEISGEGISWPNTEI